MLRNNLRAFSLHIVVSLLTFFVIGNLINRGLSALSVLVGLFISIAYVYYAYTFMNNTESGFKDFISIISVLIIGILLWLVCFSNTKYGRLDGYDNFNGLIWIFYIVYIYPFYLLTVPIQDYLLRALEENKQLQDIINIYLTLIPALLLWFGLFLKRRKRAREQE